MTEIKDFTKVRKKIQFQVDDDVFHAASTIPAETMIQFTEGFTSMDPSQMSPAQMVSSLRQVIEFCLLPDSIGKFKQRMSDPENPIDMEQLDQIVQWLFEEYGMRPTDEPSNSLSGGSLPAPGTTSTVSTQGVASISAASPLISS